MEFDQYGYLTGPPERPYGPISSDLTTLERVFVEEFGESATRRQLFESYRQFTDQIRDLMPDGFTQWVDGSFVSRKRDPGDIDLLTFVDTVTYDRHEPTFRQLRADYKSRAAPLDLFFLRTYPEEHRDRIYFESDHVQWLFDWSRTYKPPRRDKGFIELTF